MAWVNPSAVSTGDSITAATWNIAVNNSIDIYNSRISGFHAGRSGTQSVGAGDNIEWNDLTYENDDYYDAGSPDEIAFPYDGQYLVSYYVPSSASTRFTLYTDTGGGETEWMDAGTVTTLIYSIVVSVDADDKLILKCRTAGRTISADATVSARFLSGK